MIPVRRPPGLIPNAPDPVLANGMNLNTVQAPAVNMPELQFRDQSGQIFSAAKQALKQPTLDMSAVASAGRAGEAFGAALQTIGHVAGQIAAKRQQAKDVIGKDNASTAMDVELAEFQAWRDQNPNEDGWAAEWAKRLEKLTGKISQTEGISAAAAKEIASNYGRFSQLSTISVQRDAFKKTTGNAGKLLEARALEHALAGNDAGVAAALAERVSLGDISRADADVLVATRYGPQLRESKRNAAKDRAETAIMLGNPEAAKKEFDNPLFTPDERDNAKAEIDTRHARNLEVSNLMTLANDNPDIAAELAVEGEKSKKITGQDRVQIIDEARRTKSRLRSESVAAAMDKIAAGVPPTKEELENNPHLRETDKAELIDLALGKAVKNDNARFEFAITDALSFDPAKYRDEKSAIIAATNLQTSWRMHFDGPMLANLNAELDKRMKAQPDSELNSGAAIAKMRQWIDAGGMGAVKVPVLDKDGRQVHKKREGGYYFDDGEGIFNFSGYEQGEDTFEPQFQEDPVAVARIAPVMERIRKTLESEIKNGKLKSGSEVEARTLSLYMQAGGRLPPKKNPLQTGGDLPNEGMTSPPSSGLLPSLDDDAAGAIMKKYGH